MELLALSDQLTRLESETLGKLMGIAGLVAVLNFLARNAFKQQKRAELLERIRKLRNDLLA